MSQSFPLLLGEGLLVVEEKSVVTFSTTKPSTGRTVEMENYENS